MIAGWRSTLRLSLRDAAHLLGLRPRQVRRLVEDGQLDAEVICGDLLIVTESVIRRFDAPREREPLKKDAQALVAALTERSW